VQLCAERRFGPIGVTNTPLVPREFEGVCLSAPQPTATVVPPRPTIRKRPPHSVHRPIGPRRRYWWASGAGGSLGPVSQVLRSSASPARIASIACAASPSNAPRNPSDRPACLPLYRSGRFCHSPWLHGRTPRPR
jgi:hypothetical protein